MFKNTDLVKFVLECAKRHLPYWYGTCVYKCSSSLLRRKAKQYPGHYGSSRMAKYNKAIEDKLVSMDCVGMIKGFFWTNGGEGVFDYLDKKGDYDSKYASNNCPDTSANGMLRYCQTHNGQSGVIGTIPNLPGVLVFSPGHVGVYVGNGDVVEARGFNYGVVKTRLSARPWRQWAMLPDTMMIYEGVTKRDWGTFDILPGARGADVAQLQKYLDALKYDVGEIDGIYGAKTKRGVEAFQEAKSMPVTGVASASVCLAIKEAYDTLTAKCKVVGGSVYIRPMPSKEGNEPLGVAHKGDIFDVNGEVGNFYQIKYNDKNAYISKKYTDLI